jgi:hypothetical protein
MGRRGGSNSAKEKSERAHSSDKGKENHNPRQVKRETSTRNAAPQAAQSSSSESDSESLSSEESVSAQEPKLKKAKEVSHSSADGDARSRGEDFQDDRDALQRVRTHSSLFNSQSFALNL